MTHESGTDELPVFQSAWDNQKYELALCLLAAENPLLLADIDALGRRSLGSSTYVDVFNNLLKKSVVVYANTPDRALAYRLTNLDTV